MHTVKGLINLLQRVDALAPGKDIKLYAKFPEGLPSERDGFGYAIPENGLMIGVLGIGKE